MYKYIIFIILIFISTNMNAQLGMTYDSFVEEYEVNDSIDSYFIRYGKYFTHYYQFNDDSICFNIKQQQTEGSSSFFYEYYNQLENVTKIHYNEWVYKYWLDSVLYKVTFVIKHHTYYSLPYMDINLIIINPIKVKTTKLKPNKKKRRYINKYNRKKDIVELIKSFKIKLIIEE